MQLRLPSHPLARDVTFAVVLKIVLLTLVAICLFPKDQRPIVNADVIARHLFAAPPMSEGAHPQ